MKRRKKEKEKVWLEKRYEEAKLAYAALMLLYPFTFEDLEGELWVWISEYEGLYQISNFGRLKSFPRNGTVKEIKILRPKLRKAGYLEIGLSRNNKRKYFQIHRLVAAAFIPNPEGKPEVNHLDGHPLNCYVENLEWCTESENTQHAINMGLRKIGAERSQAKLTNEQVRWIRENYKRGDRKYGAPALARKFNMEQSTIQDVIHRKTYKNID